MEIIVETAGESTEQTDVLELIRDTWRKIGIELFSKPSQREVFRNRVFSGEAMMSVWYRPRQRHRQRRDISPDELAPTSAGAAAMAEVGPVLRDQAARPARRPTCRRRSELVELYDDWRDAPTREERARSGADAADPRRAGLHDRHRHRRAAAGGGHEPAAQRARGGPLQLGPGRAFRHLPPGHASGSPTAASEAID